VSSKFLRVDLGTMTGDNDTKHILRASGAYGGITIIDAWYIPAAATNAGTSHALYLLNYGSSGTALAASGTIASVGGTVDPFAADTPKQFTITAAQAFLDSGEWLVLRKTEQNNSEITADASVIIEYADGIVTQG